MHPSNTVDKYIERCIPPIHTQYRQMHPFNTYFNVLPATGGGGGGGGGGTTAGEGAVVKSVARIRPPGPIPLIV